ncbi:MAG: ABC transporter permease [Gemmatimonadaceae bacterium]|nr:ABC transporter permease [Gemmatimonadaceae bacterium]
MRGLELSIAWRYLRSRRGSRLLSLISVIAIGGVLVGVAALIVIMGVMNGLQRDLREKILIGSPDVRVLPYGEALRMAGWEEQLERVKRVPGVVTAAPFVQSEGLLTNEAGYRAGAQVVGLASLAPGEPDVTTVREKAILGEFRFDRDGRENGAVIGKLLAAKLNVWPGDQIQLLGFNNVDFNAATGIPVLRPDTFVVTGIFETGMYEYDNAYLYVSLAAGQRFAGLETEVTGLEVRTVDRWRAPAIGQTLVDSLGASVHAVDWQAQNRSLFQALKLEKLGMGVILLLIIMIAAFNIVSTLTMVVADKTREIGILRAMGLPARSIRRIFLLQGVVIGAVGTGAGVALGLTVAVILEYVFPIPLDPSVYFIDHLPVATDPFEVLAIIVASVAVAALATLYPSGQAAKLYPVDAIRHD